MGDTAFEFAMLLGDVGKEEVTREGIKIMPPRYFAYHFGMFQLGFMRLLSFFVIKLPQNTGSESAFRLQSHKFPTHLWPSRVNCLCTALDG
jgi:hypothetical protein